MYIVANKILVNTLKRYSAGDWTTDILFFSVTLSQLSYFGDVLIVIDKYIYTLIYL